MTRPSGPTFQVLNGDMVADLVLRDIRTELDSAADNLVAAIVNLPARRNLRLGDNACEY
nr:hypothetical protein [uncultured Dongia sp.]